MCEISQLQRRQQKLWQQNFLASLLGVG